MAVGPFQGYSVFDSLMRESIAKQEAMRRARAARAARAAQPATSGVTTDRAGEIATGTAGYTTSSMASSFANQGGGMQALPSGGATPVGSSYSSFATGSYGMVDGEVVDVTASPELKSAEGFKSITGGKAAVESPISSVGLSQYGKMGKVGLGVLSMLDATPFNAITSLMGGSTVVDPYGKKATVPLGILGKVAEMNIKQQYNVFDKIQAKTPGYHQFYSQGQLVSIVPQTILGNQVGYAVLGTTGLSSDQAIAQYSSMFGYDPSTVDLSKNPGDPGFGQDLTGFVPGVGGVGVDGSFVTTLGERTSAPRDTKGYLGNLADIYGIDYAVNAATAMGVREDVIDDLYIGNITSKAYYNADGSIAGYGTGTGGIVTTADGTPVRSGTGYVTYGTGYISPEQMNTLQEQGQAASTYGTKVGSQQTQMLAEQDSFLEDDNDNDGGSFTQDTSGIESRSPDYTPSSAADRRGDTDRDTGGGRDDNNNSGSTSSGGGWGGGGSDGWGDDGWAKGGFVSRKPMQEGGEADVPVATEAGVVGQEPETLPEGTTVADDVELDVPEGTFILNAAAVEFMGSADVKTMLLNAMKEAEKQGIDIEQENSTIPKEELVSLVVSRGEVIVPPQLAKIIGYDRLNKINNRGKAEVQKRIEENGQAEQPQESPEEPPVVQAAQGGAQYDDDTLVYARAALEAVEGIKNYPVVPTANSGLTVGLGLDLGQHSEFDLRERYGMSEEFIEAAKPYLAPREGSKGPTGREAENLYKELGTTFDPYFEEIRDKYFRAKFDEFRSKYPEYQSAVPKDQGALFSMYYVGGLPRYSSFRKKYEETGDLPRSIDEGLLPLLSEGNEERNRAINLLTFYYTADDADVLRDYPTAGAQEAYAMDMLETQRRTRDIDSGAFAERRGMQKGGVALPDYKDIALIPAGPDKDFPSLGEILELFKGPPSHVMSQTDVERGSTEGQRRFSNITGITPQNATYIYQNMPTYRSIVSELPPESRAEAILALDRFEKEIARQVGGPLPEQNPPRGLNSMVTDRIGVVTDRARKAAKEARQTVSKTVVGDSGGFISRSY